MLIYWQCLCTEHIVSGGAGLSIGARRVLPHNCCTTTKYNALLSRTLLTTNAAPEWCPSANFRFLCLSFFLASRTRSFASLEREQFGSDSCQKRLPYKCILAKQSNPMYGLVGALPRCHSGHPLSLSVVMAVSVSATIGSVCPLDSSRHLPFIARCSRADKWRTNIKTFALRELAMETAHGLLCFRRPRVLKG